jgi:hypothetical protein
MCFKRHIKKNKHTVKRVYPKPPPPTFTTDEVLQCHFCKYDFTLASNQIKINCAGCDQFFHCNIAGKCTGANCKTDGHQLSWCNSCAYESYGDGKCICNECYKLH